LPDDVGNEFGETVVPDREIRISAFLGQENSDEVKERKKRNKTETNINKHK